MVGLSFSKRGMTIFVRRWSSGEAAFVAYACQKLMVVPPDDLAPALAAVPARASSIAAAAATRMRRHGRVLLRRRRRSPLRDRPLRRAHEAARFPPAGR